MALTVQCPHCKKEFELTDALAGPLVAQARAEAEKLAQLRLAAATKEIEDKAIKAAANSAADEITAARLKAKTAEEGAATLLQQMKDQDAKLREAQIAQAEALRKARALEDKERELDLTIEKRTAEGLSAARQAAERAVEERLQGKVNESQETIASMARTIEDLRRKAEQGSQQNQGEAQEIALETSLAAAFPADRLEPVGKGVAGGDCVHVVVSGNGECGRILWESKVTKAWSPGWLAKLRDDGRAAKAEVLVIVSTALPKDMTTEFGLVEGVWVCIPRHAVPLAAALRQALTEASLARAAGEGLETKAGLVYLYMTGSKFKARVSAIVEAFTTMREDLDSERKAITKQWAKREAQIERVMQGTVGMYGDLQAIAGRSLTEIGGMDMAQLEEAKI